MTSWPLWILGNSWCGWGRTPPGLSTPEKRRIVPYPTSILVFMLVGIAFYAFAWLNGRAQHAPAYLTVAATLGPGSVIGVALYRWRHAA